MAPLPALPPGLHDVTDADGQPPRVLYVPPGYRVTAISDGGRTMAWTIVADDLATERTRRGMDAWRVDNSPAPPVRLVG